MLPQCPSCGRFASFTRGSAPHEMIHSDTRGKPLVILEKELAIAAEDAGGMGGRGGYGAASTGLSVSARFGQEDRGGSRGGGVLSRSSFSGSEDDDDSPSDRRGVFRRNEEEDTYEVEPAETMLISEVPEEKVVRWKTNIAPFDRVLGGGVPRGGCLMLAGPAGCGKSTILRIVGSKLTHQKKLVGLYASAEEGKKKIRDDFGRLGLFESYEGAIDRFHIVSTNDPDKIVATARALDADFVVVDSLMVLESHHPSVRGAPAGEKSQINYAAKLFMFFAHNANERGEILDEDGRERSVLLICHVTKSSRMAGPNTAKHWTDASFMLEHVHPVTFDRMDDQEKATGTIGMRATAKNRYGNSIEHGYFRMDENGLLHPVKKKASDRASPSVEETLDGF